MQNPCGFTKISPDLELLDLELAPFKSDHSPVHKKFIENSYQSDTSISQANLTKYTTLFNMPFTTHRVFASDDKHTHGTKIQLDKPLINYVLYEISN